MRQTLLLLALFVLAACTSDSNRPNPTGKGTIRAVNAIKGSPDITFRIEERLIETLPYRTASSAQEYDDFSYIFNFEVPVLGSFTLRRIASPTLKVDADRDYTFVVTGNVNSPTINVWESDERTFSDTDTVFELRVAHTAASLGTVDVYFADPAIAPALGEQHGTLSFGDILPAVDFETGDYVTTFTAAGNPSNVLYQSASTTFGSRAALMAMLFESDELDVAPYNVRTLNKQGGVSNFPDARFQPTIRFIQASIDLGDADVYDDEMLTSQVLVNHVFGEITDDISIAAGANSYTYTAAGNTGAILFESTASIIAGAHHNFIVFGDTDTRLAATYSPDRRTISTMAKVRLFQAAMNYDFLDLYVVDADAAFDPEARTLSALAFSSQSPVVALEAGSYDFYLTLFNETTIVAGPFRVDIALGEAVELFVFDTVDPATAEIRLATPQP